MKKRIICTAVIAAICSTSPAMAAYPRNHDDALQVSQTSKTQAPLNLQSALCQEITVLDNFQQSSFGNNDGPDDWAGNWVENDPEAGGAGPGAGQVQVIDGALRLDDNPDTGGQPSAARAVDLSGGGNATFSFDFRTTSDVDSGDAIAVEVSSNGGATWTELQVITGVVGEISDSRNYDISAFASNNTMVRLRVAELYGGSEEFFFIDNIEVKSSCLPGDDPTPPSAPKAVPAMSNYVLIFTMLGLIAVASGGNFRRKFKDG